MKKRMIILVLVTIIFSGVGLLLSQQNAEDAKLQKTMDTYFDEFWKFYPTTATLAGYYKYNDKLEDLSSKSRERRHEALDLFNQELVAKIDKTKLSTDKQLEHEIMIDGLDLEFVKFENLLPWEYNPIFYNEIIYNSIRSLLTKEFAPIDARLKSATERAKLFPGFIKQAKENLQTPPQIFTETAVKQLPGIIYFYKTEVPMLIDKATADGKSRFQAELAKIIPALEDYQKYLQNELLPKSTGNFRLGDQTHLRFLRLTCQNSISMEDLIARATADFNNIRREMALDCLPFFRIMYPNINMEQLTAQRGEDEARNIIIKGVLDKIKGEHSSKEDYINRIKASVEEIKTFIAQNKLLELPEENLVIEPMPPAMKGMLWTLLISPGPYETTGTYINYITPIPDDWSNDQVNSFLEEYTNYFLYFWIVEKVYPGPFVPTFFTRKDPSLIKKIYPNPALIKGWPLYTEEMLINAGFGNYDLKLRLNQLKLQLKAVMDFQLELNIHQGTMTKEQAVAYMTKRGFQTQGEVERKWNLICLNPGESAYSYIGYQEILDMEKDYKKLKGDAFNQKEFLQKLLSYGALPIRVLKTKIMQ
jgi:hypothetical protein